MARPHVPKFGNWEKDDIPYTVYFDKARKGKTGGKIINPNDPQENPEMFPGAAPPSPTPASVPHSRNQTETDESSGKRAVRPEHVRRVTREEENLVRDENASRGAGGMSTHQRGSVRPMRDSVGSDHSTERSPMHPQYQAKMAGRGRGSGSPAREGKNPNESAHGTPGRSRMNPTRRSPDKGAAIPPFGGWDVNDPSAATNYTVLFNKAREERATGSPMVPGNNRKPSYSTERNQKMDEKKPCCFPWFGK